MGKFKPSNIKGAIDTLPNEQALRNRVTDIMRRNFESYGYVPIETALVNHLELLTYKYDPDAEIVKEIYKIRDQGDRDLGLRFDLTIPFAKYIAMNRNLRMPFRRYEIGKVFRNGPVKLGRNREFYQCDIDVVGSQELGVEAEMVALAVKVYKELGIIPIVKYNNRKLLIEMIESVGHKGEFDKIIGIIDRMEKVTIGELLEDLSKIMGKEKATELIELFNNPLIHGEVIDFEEKLKALGVDGYCKFTPSLARGLNVYTGTVWEVIDAEGRVSGSIGGGGRYDRIITEWIDNGLEYPAVGMSFGLEPIMTILTNDKEQGTGNKGLVDMLVVPMKGVFGAASQLADKMRGSGAKVLVWQGDKVSKAMEYADKEGIGQVCVVGAKEVEMGKAKIKNMTTGKEVDVML